MNLEQRVEELTRDLAEALEQQAATNQVLEVMSRSTSDLQSVFETVIANATRLCKAHGGQIFMSDGQLYRLTVAYGGSHEYRELLARNPIPPGRGTLVGKVAIDHRTVQIVDVLADPDYQWREAQRLGDTRTLLGVPMLREGVPIGVIVLFRREVHPFTERQIELMTTFAAQGAIAIENIRLFEAIEEQRRQLEVASQHKTEFLANMSHELRTPLNAIIGFSEVLLEQIFGDLNAKQAEYLQDISSSGQLLLELINEILDLSKVEAGRMELEIGPFFLPETLEHGLTMVRERASRHGIALHMHIDPEIGVVEADGRKVKQVIFNLLSNAVKFTPDGGQVDVTAHQVGGEVHVTVRDTGIGIAPEDQARIFDPFQRAWHGPTRKQEGTGLGLTLSKRFVELHEGRIWLESQLGVGSVFTFSLPIRRTGAPVHVTTPEVPAAALASMEDSGPLILLVEDDSHAIELLTLYLSGADFKVAVAHDGEEGLELTRSLRPAAIILDILLPRLDGWDVLHRVKADPAIADIPVIIVSMLDELGKGFALGAADYLVKPVSRDKLLAALRRCTRVPAVSEGLSKVLAIDDDPLAIELIEAVLTPEGYTVLKTTDGEAGLVLARQELPAVVILDLLMPGVDGFTVVERLRADPATTAIPIVILTSKTITYEEKERLNGQISYLARKAEFDRAALVELVRGFCQAATA